MQMHPPNLFNPQTGCLTEQALFDYIDGRLTAPECHQAERHMLDCAFCSDALEGLEQLKDRRKVHLHIFKEEQPGSDRGLILPFNANIRLAAAAILVLFLGASILIGYILRQEKTMQLSETAAKEKPVYPETVKPGITNEQIFAENFRPGTTDAVRRELARQESYSSAQDTPEQKPETISYPAAKSPAGGAGLLAPAAPAAQAITKDQETQNPGDQARETENKAPAANSAGNASPPANTPVSGYSEAATNAPARPQASSDIMMVKSEKAVRFRNRKNNNAPPPATPPQSQDAKQSQDVPDKTTDAFTKKADENAKSPMACDEKAAASDTVSAAAAAKTHMETSHKTTVQLEKVSPANPVAAAKEKTREVRPKAFPSAILEEALNAYDHKSYALALQLFGKVLSLSPGNETALLFSGFSCLAIVPADTQAAIACFDKLLHSRSADMRSEAAWFKALTLVKESKKEQALPLLKALAEKENAYQGRAKELLKELGQ